MTRAALITLCVLPLMAQPPGFPGGGPPGGDFPGRGPGMGGKTKILKDFDKDANGYLNAEERKAARAHLATQPRRGFGGRRGGGPGGPGGFPGGGPPGGFGGPPRGDFPGSAARKFEPGLSIKPSDVKPVTTALYDMGTVRTLFFEFEDADWEKEMAEFYHTDVDVPAKLTVDGKVYPDVGVAFRGMTSFMMAPEGGKRSLDVSIDFRHDDQRLYGYRSLNLLNASGDPTMMRTALYHYIARQYIPAPKANWVRVVINGENWGLYVNTQQINGDLVKDNFKTTKGTRWKVSGSPMGQGGLAYLGDDAKAYKSFYEIKSKDDPKAWQVLVTLCKTLRDTPSENLEKALEPMLDLEGALKFLAIDKALINNDGFWTRASDYSLYLDPGGKFHLIPWDANETLRETEGGFGRRGGGEQSAQNAELDPFAGERDANKALLGKLLAVPAIRTRYLDYMRDIAENWLDWKKVGPVVAQFQKTINADLKADTKKLFATDIALRAVTEDDVAPGFGPTAPPHLSLKSFCEQRRKYLLSYPGIKR